jgi:hypothetical protein
VVKSGSPSDCSEISFFKEETYFCKSELLVPAKTMVFILAETAAGYAIFKAKDKALKNPKTLADDLASVENATSM